MTKLNLFILAILMLLALPLHAQWNIGGVFDINIASISVGSDHDISWLRLGLETKGEYSSHTAFGLGVVLDRQLSSQIDLHFEPMLLQKGATIKGWQIEVILKTVYIELPAMLRYNLQSGGSFRPYIIAGPCLGFRLSAKWDIKDGGGYKLKDEIGRVDFGAGFGGGVSKSIGKMTLFGEARYVLGFTDINKLPAESKLKNRGVQITAGATVPLGK